MPIESDCDGEAIPQGFDSQNSRKGEAILRKSYTRTAYLLVIIGCVAVLAMIVFAI